MDAKRLLFWLNPILYRIVLKQARNTAYYNGFKHGKYRHQDSCNYYKDYMVRSSSDAYNADMRRSMVTNARDAGYQEGLVDGKIDGYKCGVKDGYLSGYVEAKRK